MRRAKDIHPDLKESKDKTVVFDQKGCTFEPHALIVRTDQKVIVKSDDPVAHNTHTFPIKNQAVNFILAPKDREGKEVSNPIPEILPMQVKCDIHPWMNAYVAVVPHPYFAVTNEKGQFEIKGLPAGDYTLAAWHEEFGEQNLQVTVGASGTITVDFTFSDEPQ